MRKLSFLIGLLCGSLLFGGFTVFANAEIVAKSHVKADELLAKSQIFKE